MAKSVNKVILIGNLGKDPEIRYTQGGEPIANFSLATSENWTDKSGQKQEKTEWHRCVVWNTKASQLADIVERYVKKGDKIYVEGRIEYRSWQDREGQTRYTTEINAKELILLSGRGEGAEAYSAPAKVGAASTAPKGKGESLEEFPEALDAEEDDLPF